MEMYKNLNLLKKLSKGFHSIDTAVSLETLKDINNKLLTRPDGLMFILSLSVF